MNNHVAPFSRRRILDALSMFMVSALSITLLLYVGFGEALRTYERFQIERLIGQGELVQDSIDSYLRPGLPIRQFAGFSNIAEPIATSDTTVKSIVAVDQAYHPIFEYGEKVVLIPESRKSTDSFRHEVRQSGDIVQTILPLRNRFESVGYLVLTMNIAEVREAVYARFRPLMIVGFVASLAFMLLTYLHEPRVKSRGTGLLRVGFAISFVIVAASLVFTLSSLYSSGLQAKTRSIAAALGGRLDDVVALNLDFNDIDGVNEILADFMRLNPEVSALGITLDGTSFVHTDRALIGRPWKSANNANEVGISLSAANAEHPVMLMVDILRSGIYWQVARAVKNFAALFLASALFAGFFMELARVLQSRVAGRGADDDRATMPLGESLSAGILVKPAYFLSVFIESLTYPFLPQITYSAVRDFGATGNYASLPFVLYYFFFAAALIPAGRYENVFGARRLIILGLVLSGASYVGLAYDASFLFLVASRSLAGIGQGLLFIGVQSYVLKNTSHGQRTRAAGIIVFGYQAGALSGMAIGSLLYSQIGIRGVCNLAGVIAIATAFYVVWVIPLGELTSVAQFERARRGVFRELLMMLRDNQFVRSMAFIGVPAKSIMTGVILFALPLLLSKHGLASEDIGQISMGYAASVLWASNVVARHADRNGGIKNILFLGALLSSAGLLAIAAGGRIDVPFWSISTIVAGVCLVGIAHGFINAPVVTHVSDSEVSTSLGMPTVAATYRLLERVGHVVGPGIMGQMLLAFGQDWSTIYWVAGGVAGLAFLFAMTDRSHASPEMHAELTK